MNLHTIQKNGKNMAGKECLAAWGLRQNSGTEKFPPTDRLVAWTASSAIVPTLAAILQFAHQPESISDTPPGMH